MNIFDQFDSPSGPNVYDQFGKKDPKIGQPEELTFAEKYIAPLLEKAGIGSIAGGNLRGSAVGGAMQGAADPGVAAVQMVAHAIGSGDAADQAIQAKEREYEDARKAAGRSGFDLARAGGSAAVTSLVPGGKAAETLLGGVAKGAAQGAGLGVLTPVTDGGDFMGEKMKQAAIGGMGGAVLAPLAGALARVVSPNASTNQSVKLLRDEGVTPTIGQTLGGWANAAEEKAMSVPFVGDAIRSARGRAVADFDNAALNRVTAATGGPKVKGAGFDAYADAKAASSKAYDDALSQVTHVNFATPTMVEKLGQLEQMAATGLPENLAKQFRTFLDENVAKRISPNGSMLPDFYKKLDSEIGTKAAKYQRSSVASEQEYGDALKQLQALFRDEVKSQNPQFAHALRSADEGYANLVRVRDATKAASADSGGVFTPAQLSRSVRKNSMGDQYARGEALMQDLARAGSEVLPNRVPNSGSADRILMFAAGMHPALSIPAAAIGATAYSRPVQNALRAMVANRPEQAPEAANFLRRLIPRLAPAEVAALEYRDR